MIAAVSGERVAVLVCPERNCGAIQIGHAVRMVTDTMQNRFAAAHEMRHR